MAGLNTQSAIFRGRENGISSGGETTSCRQQHAATLRLISFGGERPVIAFGPCSPGCTKEAHLHLQNDTELDRVITLEKLPTGVTVRDENGLSLGHTTCIARRSSRTVLVTWRPDTPGNLSDSLRWQMNEGARQVRLEVRLQGSVGHADAQVPQRATRPSSAAGVKTAAVNAISTGAVAQKANAPVPSMGKAPHRTLSLARPPPPAAAAGTFTSSPSANFRSSGCLDTVTVGAQPAPACSKGSAMTTSSSPQLLGGSRPSSGRQATTPLRGCHSVEPGKALDFRRVGSVESKRERGLIAWMNSEVAPLDAAASGAGGGVEGNMARRLLGEVSGKAYLYFKRDDSFAAMASKIEAKIGIKQLTLKDPETTLSDVRMRQQALDVLTSYHPFWLAVGLQTVLGRALVLSHGHMLALMHPACEVPAFLRLHVLEHFLLDQELAAQFRHTVMKHEYWEALGARVLGRVLLLVLLLDQVVQRTDLPAGTPSLFRQDSGIKSSEQMVQELLQSRLAGVGDVRHALRMMSYHVDYVQHARDEADYRVHKPVDLRDGTRLAKLLDNLRRQAHGHEANASSAPLSAQPSSSGSGTSSSSSRLLGGVGPICGARMPSPHEDLLPSMAFPQHTGKPMDESQMRNNCLRLARALQQQGVNLQGLTNGVAASSRDVTSEGVAKSVAEGLVRVDQRVTLGVLWQMALHFKLRRHVDARTLEREAARLRRAAASASQFSGGGAVPHPAAAPAADDPAFLRYKHDPTSQALLQWVRAACAPYGLHVNDLTWSLSDGRVLSYLIHSYLPEVLPRSSVYAPDVPASADAMASLTGGTEYVELETLMARGWTSVYEMGGVIHDEGLAAAFKRGVAANFQAVHAAGEALGVPAMLGPEDYLEDGPDELSALLYVALLGEALLKLTVERRAGYVIMDFLRRRLCWKPSYMRASLQRFKVAVQAVEAATTIQAFWRMRQQRSRYTALRRAACVLQAYTRQHLAQLQLQRWRQAAVAIQKAWRAHVARQRLHRARHAASAIQAAWRGFSARKSVARQRAAALLIQRHVRLYLAQNRRSTEQEAVSQLCAALRIQTAWRGFCARRCFQRIRAAVVTIQAFERLRQAQSRYLRLKQAAVVIQSAWRAHKDRLRYAAQRQAAVRIQTWWRRVRAVRAYAQARAHVVRIQAYFRGRLARRHFASSIRQLVRIQAAWRAVLARRQTEMRRQALAAAAQHRAAAILQAVVRGHRLRQLLSRQRWAAVTIQAFWRMRSCRLELNAMRQAAITIQSAFRGLKARRYMDRCSQAAVIIQSLWRRRAAMLSRQDARAAATTLQAAWRGYVARRRFVQLQQAALCLQAAWRAKAARAAFLRLRAAAVALQAIWRGWQMRKGLGQQHAAATVIQAFWRSYAARQRFIQMRLAALQIQSWTRGMLARRRYAQSVRAVLAIQAAWRARCVRTRVKEQYNAVTVIQTAVRAWRARRSFLQARNAATVIQSVYRGWRTRKALRQMHEAARAIQAAWRRHQLAKAAVVVQARWRMFVARRNFLCIQRAVLLLQAHTRGFIARRRLRDMRAAVVAFQGAWRCRLARRELARRAEAYYSDLQRRQAELLVEIGRQYMRKVEAARRIQAYWRGFMTRKLYLPVLAQNRRREQERRAAVLIQTVWRSYNARKQYLRVRKALETITCILLPVYRARKELQRRRKQHSIEVWAATAIQASVRMWLVKRRFLAAVSAAVKIQAAWRGYSVRLRGGRAEQEARRRLAKAALEAHQAPHRQIGHKTREALDTLHRKTITQVSAAVEFLETATRYSRDCCQLVVRKSGVVVVLRHMRSCTRTKQHTELFNRMVAVLSNICRYDMVADVFHTEECLSVLSERLQFFRDTEEVFVPLVSLLKRLIGREEHAAEVAPAVLRHWEGIHQVLFRKADMERKYLERLEGQKGSDVSARESARKLLVVQEQVAALEALISRASMAARDERAPLCDVAHDQDKDVTRKTATGKASSAAVAPTATNQGSAAITAPIPGFKNTLVKDVVQRMANPGGSTGGAGIRRSGGGATGSPVQSKNSGRAPGKRADG